MSHLSNIATATALAVSAFTLPTPALARADEAHFNLASLPRAVATATAPAAAMMTPGSSQPEAGPTLPESRAAHAPAGLVASSERDRLERQIMRMELAYQALNAVDAVQTISCLRRDKCVELNPMIGGNPSTARVIAQKAATGGLHYLATRALLARSPHTARIFEYVSLTFQTGIVAWNFHTCF